MPLISTRGAASARGFGFGATTGATGFKYGAMAGITSQTLRFGASMLPNTPPSAFPANLQTTNGMKAGIVVDGNVIATVNGYSTNSGASWTNVAQGSTIEAPSQTSQGCAGLNGGIAYNPIGKRVAVTWAYYTGKAYVQRTNTFVPTTGAATGYNMSLGSNSARQILYAPALNCFVMCKLDNSTYSSFDGSTGTFLGIISLSPGNWSAGVSVDGYPLITQFNGSTGFFLRKYLAADLSSSTNLGTLPTTVQSLPYHSPITYCPINGKYFHVSTSGGSIYFSRSTGSSDPENLQYYTSYGTIYNPIYNPNIFEDKDTGYLYASFLTAYTVKTTFFAGLTLRSTDGGNSWTEQTSYNGRAFCRNFSYP